MQRSSPSPRRPSALALVATLTAFLWAEPRVSAGETAVVTRLSCAPELAKDTGREPKERMYDYRRYLEVAFIDGREVRCFAAGDYAAEPVMDAVKSRLNAALQAREPRPDAQPLFLAYWQRAPEDAVPPTDVTRVSMEMSACLRPATEARWICRAYVRAWYFKPGMSREGVLYDLTVLATYDRALSTDHYPFATGLSFETVQARGKPPLDTAMLFP